MRAPIPGRFRTASISRPGRRRGRGTSGGSAAARASAQGQLARLRRAALTARRDRTSCSTHGLRLRARVAGARLVLVGGAAGGGSPAPARGRRRADSAGQAADTGGLVRRGRRRRRALALGRDVTRAARGDGERAERRRDRRARAREALGHEAGAIVSSRRHSRRWPKRSRAPARHGPGGGRGQAGRRRVERLTTCGRRRARSRGLYAELLGGVGSVVVRDRRLLEAVGDDPHQRRLQAPRSRAPPRSRERASVPRVTTSRMPFAIVAIVRASSVESSGGVSMTTRSKCSRASSSTSVKRRASRSPASGSWAVGSSQTFSAQPACAASMQRRLAAKDLGRARAGARSARRATKPGRRRSPSIEQHLHPQPAERLAEQRRDRRLAVRRRGRGDDDHVDVALAQLRLEVGPQDAERRGGLEVGERLRAPLLQCPGRRDPADDRIAGLRARSRQVRSRGRPRSSRSDATTPSMRPTRSGAASSRRRGGAAGWSGGRARATMLRREQGIGLARRRPSAARTRWPTRAARSAEGSRP